MMTGVVKKSEEITHAPNKQFTSIFTYCCEKKKLIKFIILSVT